jgi:hypothetical protein
MNDFFEIVLWGVASLILIVPFIVGVITLIKKFTTKSEYDKIADSIMTIYTYRNPDSQTIEITNADDSPVPKDAEPFLKDAIFKKAGYQHIQQYKIEPPQATLEASTELKGVEVEVTEWKTPEAERTPHKVCSASCWHSKELGIGDYASPKKELPKTVDEAVNGMKAKGNTIGKLIEPFEPHPEIKA